MAPPYPRDCKCMGKIAQLERASQATGRTKSALSFFVDRGRCGRCIERVHRKTTIAYEGPNACVALAVALARETASRPSLD